MRKAALKNSSRIVFLFLVPVFTLFGCSASRYRQNADEVAAGFIMEAQLATLGKTEPFSIEPASVTLRRRLLQDQNLPYAGAAALGVDELPRIKHWPEKDYPPPPYKIEKESPPWSGTELLKLNLEDALQIAAANNREYQTTKENIFQNALILDLESNNFRNTFFGALQTIFEENEGANPTTRGIAGSGSAEWRRKLKTGATLASRFIIDVAKLLNPDRSSSYGIFADATISIPLMAGSGEFVVTEPLTQAERDLGYSIYTFERFKRTLAVDVASQYLKVLQGLETVKNEEENYRNLIFSARSASRLADAGRLPKFQVDQAHQDVLRARSTWIAAQQVYAASLDQFKLALGIPVDARIELDGSELGRLAAMAQANLAKGNTDGSPPSLNGNLENESAGAPIEIVPPSREGGGPLEMDPSESIEIGLAHRMDLRILQGQVYDAQRKVVVAADALRANLTLIGAGQLGERRDLNSADLPNAQLRFDEGLYSSGLLLDLPWERTAQQDAYRNSFIVLQQAVRAVQGKEDEIKFQLRDELRVLLETRENYRIQTMAVDLAGKRVKSTELLLQAGRAQVRDILDAQEALVSAQNALTSAIVNYRIAELELQRDMGVLVIDNKGLWSEYHPKKSK
jgi:outer membrane protein TolC